ncbi:MAG: NfeD family protein [Acholeplasmataceae bacterium]
METTMVWIWLIFFIAAVIFEFLTEDFVSIWFAIAAIPTFLLAIFDQNLFIQIIVFVVIATVLLLFTRPAMMKYLRTNEIKTNVDSIVGTTGIVTEEITPDTVGRIKLRGIDWSAVAKETIRVNERVRVLDVEGVKVVVEKI